MTGFEGFMPTSYEHQLDILLERFNFHFTKNQIKQVIETKAISKRAFRDDVLSAISSNRELQNKFDELGLLALQLDTRQVEVFDIASDDKKEALNALFENPQLSSEAVLNEAFPFPVEDREMLASMRKGVIYPIRADLVNFGGNNYKRLVVSTVVEKEIEEPVPEEHLSQAGQQRQSDDTTYMMKRTIRNQLFHVVYWNAKLSKLILSVDRNAFSVSVAQDQLFLLRQFLMSRGVDSGTAINVFGAIDPLYNSEDGYVTKIGHVTTDGNPVRIPLKSKQQCLKEDNYHKAGEGGGHVHAKFAVAKKWTFELDDSVRTVDIEVGLMGQPRMLDTAQPLSDFSINKSKRLEDMSFAIEKVLSLVPKLS